MPTCVSRRATYTEVFVQVLEGGKVVDRTGAIGKLRSVYCRDPDGNLIEYVDAHHGMVGSLTIDAEYRITSKRFGQCMHPLNYKR